MAVNAELVLAGIAGFDDLPSFGWFAPSGSTLPADATTAVDPAFLDMGYGSTDGLTISTETDTTNIEAYGAFAPVRTLINSETRTFTVTALETNVVTLALQNRLPVSGAGAPTVDTLTGAIDVTAGPSRSVRYAAVFHAKDGANHIRKVMPSVELTSVGDEQVARGAAVQYEFGFTAYPDSTGVSVYSYYVLDALKA